MNILFVNNFYNIFAKADCGASQRTMCLLRALAKLGHVDVISFVERTISDEPNIDVVYSQDVETTNEKGNRFDKFFKLFKWNKPYAIYPENKQKSKVIEKFVKENHYDFIVTRYLQFACDCGLMKYKERLVIDFDDDLRDAALMEAKRAKTIRNRLYGMIYANTLRRLSHFVSTNIHQAYFSSPNRPLPNAEFLPNISVFTKSLNGVSFSDTLPVILLVGNFRYFPNEYGLLHFLKDIFPIIRKQNAKAEVHVVGNIPQRVKKQIDPYIGDGVSLLGYVQDLMSEYSQCRCVAVPIWHGTGTSVKLVEAMSLNRAVVTTSMGVRGLHNDFVSGNDYLSADDYVKFAECTLRLLSDEVMNQKISSSALHKIKKYYSADNFNAIIKRTL